MSQYHKPIYINGRPNSTEVIPRDESLFLHLTNIDQRCKTYLMIENVRN